MPATHVITFKLKDDTDLLAARSLFEGVFEMKNSCKKADGVSYMLSVRGGKQITEGLLGKLAKEWEWTFVFEFENTDDLQYFLLKDPTHQKFAGSFRPLLADAIALTFDDHVFA
ncbi:hypothetical protein BD626DRAFT_632824 [Schizophyllum amplum]|uniref:Stress-response A/B barrel domain-containing protein n=1 Tax=Schizophyllum amplum TaxID=97359 RepID=A0A550C5I7_9AGAR|nr:hypothetical protein BD626DRAFT_632824 [Auriculariopsis ampla]